MPNPQQDVEAAVDAAAKARPGDAAAIDRAFRVTRTHFPDASADQVLQAVLARRPPDPAELHPLLTAASNRHAGLCPTCLNRLPDSVPPLPPPLVVAAGRASGDGYLVEVTDGWTRHVSIDTPLGPADPESPVRAYPPRLCGTIAGGLALAVGAVATAAVPVGLADPRVVAGGAAVVGGLAYLFWSRNKPLPRARHQAVDVAWAELIAGIGRQPAAVGFLVRLIRASLTAGNPTARADAVAELAKQSAVLANKGGVYVQFHAAARVLQVFDATTPGRERTTRLTTVFDAFLRGQADPVYAEAAATVITTGLAAASPADLERISGSLSVRAFEAGWRPDDCPVLTRLCPAFARLGELDDPGRVETRFRAWATGGPGRSPRSRNQAKTLLPFLASMAAACPLCGTIAVPRQGQLGVNWDDLARS